MRIATFVHIQKIFDLARIFHELLSRDHEDGRATRSAGACAACWATAGCWFPYLNGTSQVPTPEDARKDGHIIRARCAPLSPASGFPVSWSRQVIHEISGLPLEHYRNPPYNLVDTVINMWLQPT
jgi:hypothetical protein